MIDLIRSFRLIRDALQASTAYGGRGGAQFAGALEGARRGARPIEGPVSPLYLRSEAAFPGFVEDALRLTVADS
ncbi:hypothetical protein, partial [Ensifer sp. ENS02]|uniref:hypothetical protein n=1 Tax=Ensifer sp. ENS02 TaxID=2769290 RepID=UPI001AEDF2A9